MVKKKHPGGRPPKFKNVEEMQVNFKSLNTDDFDRESDLVDFIALNIKVFTIDILNDELVSFEIEKPINKRNQMSPRGRRIDIYIKGKSRNYIIETKNPQYYAENRYAIGQLLDYGREIDNAELVLITTKYDLNTAKTIKHYNLPIRYIYFDKKVNAEYLRDG